MRLRNDVFAALAAAALAAAGLALAGCTAHKKPSTIETRLANLAKDVVIPLEAEHLANPAPDTPLAIAQGQQVYQAHCALCHSSDGHSQNALGLAMYPPAMDLTSPHVQAWKDQELYWIVNNGIGLTGMPAWQGILSADEEWELARYIHALPGMTPEKAAALAAMAAPAPPAAAGGAGGGGPDGGAAEAAYGKRVARQEGCLMCHRIGGAGEAIGPDLTHEARRGRSAAWLAGHFKNPSAYVKNSDMPAFDNLTPAQLRGLIALLQAAH